MVFSVDFHMRDELGRVPALVEGSSLWSVQVGDLVLAEDAEGNQCKARVDEISQSQSTVYLALVSGTTDPSPRAHWFVESSRAEREEQEPTDFERFEALTKALVTVPKSDIRKRD